MRLLTFICFITTTCKNTPTLFMPIITNISRNYATRYCANNNNNNFISKQIVRDTNIRKVCLLPYNNN